MKPQRTEGDACIQHVQMYFGCEKSAGSFDFCKRVEWVMNNVTTPHCGCQSEKPVKAAGDHSLTHLEVLVCFKLRGSFVRFGAGLLAAGEVSFLFPLGMCLLIILKI